MGRPLTEETGRKLQTCVWKCLLGSKREARGEREGDWDGSAGGSDPSREPGVQEEEERDVRLTLHGAQEHLP